MSSIDVIARQDLEEDLDRLEERIARMHDAVRRILIGNRALPFCPFCARDGEIDPGDGLGCCTSGAVFGFWGDDGIWYLGPEVLR